MTMFRTRRTLTTKVEQITAERDDAQDRALTAEEQLERAERRALIAEVSLADERRRHADTQRAVERLLDDLSKTAIHLPTGA